MTVDLHCLKCHAEFEDLFNSHAQMINTVEGRKVPCPKCGNRELRRLFPSPGQLPTSVEGQDKLSDNHLTIGHAVDKSNWV